MIIFKKLAWSNLFSYGENNSIDLSKYPLLQLTGKNGYGKSSIPLILEEVLFNKNSKGIKKANLLNRYSKTGQWKISLEFEKDSDTYLIDTVRKATQTVKLFKNGTDISSHTATNTYKQIEQILGYDHKTFSQIVYQISAFNLEFLKATDTTRKKFLIDLFGLSKYSAIAENVKVAAKDVSNELETLDMKLNTVEKWLERYSSSDLTYKELQTVPESLTEESKSLAELQSTLLTLKDTNKKIVQNNKYKEILAGITLDTEVPTSITEADIVEAVVLEKNLTKELQQIESDIKKIGPILTKCSYCGQAIDSSHKEKMAAEATLKLPEAKKKLKAAQTNLSALRSIKATYDAYIQKVQEFERYSSLISPEVPSDLLDQADIESQVLVLQKAISSRNSEIKTATEYNLAVETHNAKVKVVLEQLADMQADKEKLGALRNVVSKRAANLAVLLKTFSPTGFIAYKIESLVKDLEKFTNEYLTNVSDGRFQLYFKISSSDKLDVVITDNGEDIDIAALSNGELAKVNISALLGIRKLMQSLSNVRTNLLILDETLENLDIDAKEKLIECLLMEDSLNTILVSHSFSHPLIHRIEVIKTNNISRIEE